MGGLFGVVSKKDCMHDLFYGTDYHSHLGTRRGGLTVINPDGFIRFIHNIENAQFRSKFELDILNMKGKSGIGVISDYEDQPLLIRSHLGKYAIVTVGVIKNADELVKNVLGGKAIHFSEMSIGEINPTELAAALINREQTFEDGIQNVMEAVEGSSSYKAKVCSCSSFEGIKEEVWQEKFRIEERRQSKGSERSIQKTYRQC